MTSFYFQTSRSGSGERDFDEELIAAVDEYFKGFETSYFSEGIKKLKERWTKCLEVEGVYVEKCKRILHGKGIFIYFLPYLLNDPRKLKLAVSSN